jgi:hypothetical protein
MQSEGTGQLVVLGAHECVFVGGLEDREAGLAGRRHADVEDFVLPGDLALERLGPRVRVIGVHDPHVVAFVEAPDAVEAKAGHVLVSERVVPVDLVARGRFAVHADLEVGIVEEGAQRQVALVGDQIDVIGERRWHRGAHQGRGAGRQDQLACAIPGTMADVMHC